jgi:hypothetical protein
LQCHTKPLAVTLTFDLVTPKTIGVCVTLRTTSIPSLKVKGKQLLKLSQHIEGVQFHAKPLAVTLTFDLVTPKSIGVCIESCTTCIPSLKVVGEKLLKLSQHIESVDGRFAMSYKTISRDPDL